MVFFFEDGGQRLMFHLGVYRRCDREGYCVHFDKVRQGLSGVWRSRVCGVSDEVFPVGVSDEGVRLG